MTVRCYDLHDQTTFSAVVFAQSHADAIWIGNLHLESLSGRHGPMMTAIERQPGRSGRAAEKLMAAINEDTPGVGHLQRDGSWLILPPGERLKQPIRPSSTELHVFTDEDGDEVVLFTHDPFRAGELYDAIHDRLDLLPSGWMPHAWEAWTTVGLVRHGIQAEQRGIEGVGIYDSESGWQILPLDYAALGIAPCSD